MIGPVSSTGRAMMASLQQAIQNVKSMATQGVAPLTDLYAMMNQFQRLKQQQVQAPQTPPTIRDQLNMAEQQQAQQQMAMQQGLGGMPAPVMDNAQFAGGGIVAFAQGSKDPVSSDDSLDSEIASLESALQADDYIKQGLGGSLGRAVATRTMPLSYAERLNAEKRLSQLKAVTRSKVKEEPSILPSGPPIRPEFKLSSEYGLPQEAPSKPTAPDIFARSAPPAAAAPAATAPPSSGRDLAVRKPAAPAATAPAVTAPPELSREEMEDREYKRLQDFRKREGLGTAREEYRTFLSDEGNKLAEQFGKDRMLAFAEAGFKMAAAASRPGATFLGALSEGAISGTQALRGLQKEMDANRRGLRESMLKLRQAEEAEKEGDFKAATQMAQQARTELFERQKHADNLRMDERRINATIKAAEIAAGSREAVAAARGKGEDGIAATVQAQLLGLYVKAQDRVWAAYDDDERATAERELNRIGQQLAKLGVPIPGINREPVATGGSNPYSNLSDDELRKRLGI